MIQAEVKRQAAPIWPIIKRGVRPVHPKGVKTKLNLYKIADLTIAMDCSGETVLKQGKPYKTDAGSNADIRISIGKERLSAAKVKHPQLTLDEWEYIMTGFDFSRELISFDGFCLHASAVGLEGKAVLFSGPCGTGKSTHARLWREVFGRNKAVVVINDDKPALRLYNGTFYVYGTPWSGKSHLHANIKMPLQAIVFLKQAKENKIRRLTNKEAVQMLVYQSLRPDRDTEKMEKLLSLLDRLLARTPVYQLDCTVSHEAVKIAYNEINHVEKRD